MLSRAELRRLLTPRRLRIGVAILIAFSTATAILYIYMNTGGIDPGTVSIVAASAVAAEAVRALRLQLLAGVRGVRGWLRAFTARLAGNAVAAATPTSVGGELVRGYLVLGATVRAAVVGLYDAVSDLWANTVLASLLLPLYRQPLTIALTLAGFTASIAWALALHGLPWLASRLLGSETPTVASMRPSLGLQVASILLGVAGFLVAALGLSKAADVGFVEALSALSYGLLAGLVPTPGGLLAVDVVMTYLAGGRVALAWRLGSLAAVLPGAVEVVRLIRR